MSTLKLVLKNHWFNEIKSGRKTHEYREVKPYWVQRIMMNVREQVYMLNWVNNNGNYDECPCWLYCCNKVEFRNGYRKNAEKMLFWVKSINVVNGIDTDLKIDKPVFDIELWDEVKKEDS